MSTELLAGPKYHSPSSINKFLSGRSEWYLRYYLGKKLPYKQSKDTARGNAVERALNYWVTEKEPDVREAINIGCWLFAEQTAGLDVDIDFRNSIARCINAGIVAFNERYLSKGYAFKIQEEIWTQFEDVVLPIKGYLDYSADKLIVDCKVSAKTPSQLPQNYIIQGALYKKATGKDVEFHYIIPLKNECKPVPLRLTHEQFEQGLRLAKQACFAMEALYNADVLSSKEMRAAFFPNPDDLWANDKKTIMHEFGLDEDE